MKGLVLGNKIVDVCEQKFEVHGAAYWINVPDDCKSGWEVVNDQAVRPQEPSAEELMRDLRMTRNRKLRDTDWWVLPDRTPTEEQLAYRQALREITDKYKSVGEAIWPTKPE